MTRLRQFAVILISVVGLTSVFSHIITEWAGFETDVNQRRHFKISGKEYHAPPIIIAGGSIIGAAVDCDMLATNLERPVIPVVVPYGSPCEIEYLTRDVSNADVTVVGVSIYELDDQFISEFRADIVPITQTASDLWESHCDWAYVQRMINYYPQSCLRMLFPTLGRSMSVLVGVRAHLRRFLRPSAKGAPDELLKVNQSSTERITEWPRGRLLRNLAEMEGECLGRHKFDGPKRLAFIRLLRQQARHGKVVVLLLPVSPPYRNELVNAEDKAAYEKLVAEIAKEEPDVKWVRIDQLPEFESTDYFRDFNHMNLAGEQIATKAIAAELKKILIQP